MHDTIGRCRSFRCGQFPRGRRYAICLTVSWATPHPIVQQHVVHGAREALDVGHPPRAPGMPDKVPDTERGGRGAADNSFHGSADTIS